MEFPIQLRADQLTDVMAVWRAWERKGPPTVLCRPTGSGKTVVAAFLISLWLRVGVPVLFVVERRGLVEQAADKLRECGVPHGIIMAGHPHYPGELVQVVSRDTLFERGVRRNRMFLPRCGVFIRDECHRGMAPTDCQIYQSFHDAFFLGLSATPALTDGRAMAIFWQEMIQNTTMRGMVDSGDLLGNVIYEPNPFSDLGLHSRGTDFRLSEETAALVDLQCPIGNVISDWRKYGEDRPTFAFCPSVRSSVGLAAALQEAGITAAHVDYRTEVAERGRIKSASLAGEYKIISSCELLGYGVDWPHIGCCIHLRPCRHAVPWVQFCGRACRTFGDKKYAIQIDHVGNTRRLGYPEDISDWNLATGKWTTKPRPPRETPRAKTVRCECGFEKPAGSPCPNCGVEPAFPPASPPEMQSGAMQPARRLVRSPAQKTWDSCLGVAIRRGASLRSAFAHYRHITGEWPPPTLNKLPGRNQDLDIKAIKWYEQLRPGNTRSRLCGNGT